MLYNYLFFKGYQLARKSRNWRDTPILFAIMIIAWCLILNLATIFFLLEALGSQCLYFGSFFSNLNEYKYLTGAIVLLLLLLYYTYKGRGKRIVTKFEEREKNKEKNIHPGIIVIIAYVMSFVLAMLAAMYKNGDGIFR